MLSARSAPTGAAALAYTRAAAAEATGLPGRTIDHAIATGELPAIRSGRRLVILREDIEAWLQRCKERGRIPSPIDDDGRARLAQLNRARKKAAT